MNAWWSMSTVSSARFTATRNRASALATPNTAGITRCSPAVLIRARCSRRRHAHAQIRVRDWNAAAVRSFGKEGQALTMRQVSLLIQRCAARPCSAKDVSEQHLAFLFGAFFEI